MYFTERDMMRRCLCRGSHTGSRGSRSQSLTPGTPCSHQRLGSNPPEGSSRMR